ncbi:MAG TPA: class I SAM-dependent methyltransferase [Solirubrobacteraceae bacterium]|jgi:hypothetical protein
MTLVPADPTETYCRQLSLHAELLWDHELPILASAPAFIESETIIDLGAGNGAFGRKLAVAFPDKRFLGVEPDAAIFAVGRRSAFPPNYCYVLGGYESITGTHDLLFARHVVMYVPDRPALYAWARQRVRSAIVVSWNDAASMIEPALPIYEAALQDALRSRADELATRYAGDRALAGTPAEWATAGFVHSGTAPIAAAVSDPDGRRLYHHVIRLSIMGMNPDAVSRALLDELFGWSVEPGAHAVVGETYDSLHNPVLVGAEPVRAAVS